MICIDKHLDPVHFCLEGETCEVNVVDVGVEDAHGLLLQVAYDDGDLQPPVIGHLCAYREVAESGLLHLPLDENLLLQVDVVVVKGGGVSKSSIVDRHHSRAFRLFLLTHGSLPQIMLRHDVSKRNRKYSKSGERREQKSL